MNRLQQMHRLITYDGWANREALRTLRACEAPPQRAIAILNHIVGSEKVWLERVRSQQPTSAIWPSFSLDECEAHIVQLPDEWRRWLESIQNGGFETEVAYKNSKGETWKNRIEDILLHVLTHSAYHRGQIAVHVRTAGAGPANTDFIQALRQKQVG